MKRFAKPPRNQSGALRETPLHFDRSTSLHSARFRGTHRYANFLGGKDANGIPVDLFTITAPNIEVKLATYGARIVSIRVRDRAGQMSNVLVGPDSLPGFLENRSSVMGATIGLGNQDAME